MSRKWTHERITRRNKMLSQFIHLIHMERLKKKYAALINILLPFAGEILNNTSIPYSFLSDICQSDNRTK